MHKPAFLHAHTLILYISFLLSLLQDVNLLQRMYGMNIDI